MKAASHLSWFWRLVLIQKGSIDQSESLLWSDVRHVCLRQRYLGNQHGGKAEDYPRRMFLAGVCCTGLQPARLHPCTQHPAHSLHTENLSENPKAMPALEQIVLNGYAVTIFTENQGNPLCSGNVAILSRSFVLKPLKMDSPWCGWWGPSSGERASHTRLVYYVP